MASEARRVAREPEPGACESPPRGRTYEYFRHLNAAVDEVRRAEVRRLRGEAGQVLKGTRYLLLKNPWNLTPAERRRLSTAVKLNTRLVRASKNNCDAVLMTETSFTPAPATLTFGGFGSEVAAVGRKSVDYLDVPIVRVGARIHRCRSTTAWSGRRSRAGRTSPPRSARLF